MLSCRRTGRGTAIFSGLTVSDDLPQELRTPVLEILSNIYEEEGKTQGICFGADGSFRQGILAGKADKQAAEYVGYLARKRRKEQKSRELQEQIEKHQQDHRRVEHRNCTTAGTYGQITGGISGDS